MMKIDTSTLDVYEMLAQALIQSGQSDVVCENANIILTSVETIRTAIYTDDLAGVVHESQKYSQHGRGYEGGRGLKRNRAFQNGT